MMKWIYKLVFADQQEAKPKHNSLYNQYDRVLALWYNKNPNDYNSIGLERIIQLFLLSVQFLFLGLYIRALFSLFGILRKNVGVEIYLIAKFLFVYAVLHYGWYKSALLGPHSLFLYISWYFALETMLYIPTLIFCQKVFVERRSVGRSTLLLFINYFEMIQTFALTYLTLNYLSFSNTGAVVKDAGDCLYFSFISATTIGFGDIVPFNQQGKNLVIFQSITFLIFGSVLLNIMFYKEDKGTKKLSGKYSSFNRKIT